MSKIMDSLLDNELYAWEPCDCCGHRPLLKSSGLCTSCDIFEQHGVTACPDALAAARREAHKEVFDRIYELVPPDPFMHWTPKQLADFFVALGRIEIELELPDPGDKK